MKENFNDTSHDLLVKYLLGEASPAEVISVQQWLQTSEDNARYFDQLKTIWDESRQLAPEKIVNEEEAWQRFRQRRAGDTGQAKIVPLQRKRVNWLRAAAVFVLLAGAGYITLLFTGQTGKTLASGNKVTTYTLPDGSEIVLNKNSSVSYERAFNTESRTVALKGEAFFKVTADSRKPFIINTDDVAVQVVGTSFNVKNTEVQTEIVVETGVVNVSKNKHSVQLRENEKAVIKKDSDSPEKTVFENKLYNYYRTNQFICVETPLPELVAVLNEAYKSDIRIGSSTAASLKLTTTLENKSLDQILEVIRETLGISIEKSNGAIILK